MKKLVNTNPRGRILEIADRLFYSDGVRATGTEKIMADADVAKATFYRHFPSKDALVLAYLDHRDQALWDFLAQPAPPKTLREALVKFEQSVNHPDITSCPFLRIAAEYPAIDHPFHQKAIEHQEKILAYLLTLLKPIVVDAKAAASAILGVIDGAFSLRLLHGTSKQISLVAAAEAVLKSFQNARSHHP
jgi:AcrR family transcriptional regulator